MQWDIIFIGGGMACAGALRAASLGMRVVVVDKQGLGGTSLHAGCLPARTLWHGARLFRLVGEADDYGILAPGTILNLDRLHRKRLALRDHWQGLLRERLETAGVSVLQGTGSLESADSVIVRMADGQTRTEHARHIVIATGSRPRRPAELVPDGQTFITSDELLELRILPERVCIVGGGSLGCEAASFFSALGCGVTVLEKEERLLPELDADLAAGLGAAFRESNIAVHHGTTARDTRRTAEGVDIALAGASSATITADLVLLATGRTPVTSRLGLERLHVATDEVGCIKVDESFATSVPGIYAVGDVVGAPMLASTAALQACRLVERIARVGGDERSLPDLQLMQIDCTPGIATVGMAEADALARYGGDAVDVSRMGQARDRLKLVRVNGRLVGAHAVGEPVTRIPAYAAAIAYENGQAGFDDRLLWASGLDALSAVMNI